MTPERWALIRRIFEGVLERPQQDRAAFLRVQCARDEELRREVESLLVSHEASTEFLNTPAVDLNRALLAVDDLTGEIPRVQYVGPYQLERRIGKGGMGSVWLARRVDHAYEKKVAVKMVKRGMDTQEILRRFRMERQVLAGLDHPNIARLIDGGSTPDGLPYLVMEYVEGTRIDRYCETRQSSISERLKLFRDVCAAVQYAHQSLVVHRDIKASNILVTEGGVVKLLDFGIAKLIRTEFSTLAAAETRPELRPMTLDYASPEQVRGDSITTSTDVYSLGVLLFKLLTGKFPYGEEDKSREALQRAICEMEPLRPSSVVLSDEKRAIPQATQKMEVEQAGAPETREKARRRLKRKLAGDLDVILLMALRKEPARRYASVEQFSEDIRKYLEGQPVIARRDTFGYRAGKFLRRNAPAVAAVSVASVLLLASTVWSVASARRTSRLLEATSQREMKIEPALVETYAHLGEAYTAAAEPRRAANEFARAVEAGRDFLARYPERADVRQQVARATMHLADLSPADAGKLYGEALKEWEALAQAAPGDLSRQREALAAARKLGFAQYRAADRLAALTTFSRALTMAEAWLASESGGANSGSVEARRAVAECNFDVGEVLSRNGERPAAAAKFRKALDLYRELAGLASSAAVGDSREESEGALRALAAKASAEVRREMETELGLWGVP